MRTQDAKGPRGGLHPALGIKEGFLKEAMFQLREGEKVAYTGEEKGRGVSGSGNSVCKSRQARPAGGIKDI